MVFNMYLIMDKKFTGNICLTQEKKYYSDIDDETSVILDICDIFYESKIVKFIVSGFGEEEWPVDCKYDLPGIIEVIPGILRNMEKGNYNFILDFFEQGIERKVIFNECDGVVIASCLSRTKWKAIPSVLKIEKTELNRVLKTFYKNFILYASIMCNDFIKNPLLTEWLNIIKS